MPEPSPYRADPAVLELGDAFYDPVRPADFPQAVLRFRNDRWAPSVGLGEFSDPDWIRHFARFEPLPDNLPQPLALRYHGHQFRVYNPDIGDGRGFLFAQRGWASSRRPATGGRSSARSRRSAGWGRRSPPAKRQS
jgi:uncharacterized protein YdiU (UPF0061 family)